MNNINDLVENFQIYYYDEYYRAKARIGGWEISITWFKKQTAYEFIHLELDIYEMRSYEKVCVSLVEQLESIKYCIDDFYKYIDKIIEGL